MEIGQNEIRLRFNAQTWNSRIDKSQLITGEMLSEFVSAPRNKEYCVWRPDVPAQAGLLLDKAAADSILYWLEFRKDRQSASSAVFEMESNTGVHLGALQCYFPQSQTPADVTVGRWLSIVGTHMALEVRGQ